MEKEAKNQFSVLAAEPENSKQKMFSIESKYVLLFAVLKYAWSLLSSPTS